MAASELIEALQALAHERKIDEFYLIERLEASLANSYQRILDLEYDARVTIDRNTGKIYVYELVPVGEPDEETGEYTEFEERDVTPDDVSRIAALYAKNVIGSIVRDAGRQSIYEEFSREHSTTENKVPGTGLGLPIIKSMIELMGGSIQVESRQGIGTKFTVDLSFDIASKEEVYGNQNAMKPPAIHTIKGTRILLVEDNDLNAEIAKTVLEDVGALITRVEDGQQAVKLFKEKPAGTFDAILMDLMMPVMDGYTATKKIRSLEHSDAKTIPIIAMTANAFQEDAEKCIAVGMNAHLAKPLDIEKMKNTIKDICP